MLHIGGDFLDALDEYVQAVIDIAPEAAEEGVNTMHADLQRRARLNPRWADLADHLETWRDRDGIQVGIRNPTKVEAAQVAEYGDKESGPVPLIRHMPGSASVAGARMDDILHTHLGGTR
jgi:hypothetical protein